MSQAEIRAFKLRSLEQRMTEMEQHFRQLKEQMRQLTELCIEFADDMAEFLNLQKAQQSCQSETAVFSPSR
jgi:hypothetical protein